MKQHPISNLPYFLADQRYSFTPDHLLGKGATGNVYKGYDHKQNKHVAIKVIETGKMNQVEKSLIQNEKQSLKILKHDNIMKLHHIQEQQDFTFIVSQIYEGGSLKQYLEKKGRFGEQQAMEFFRKIIQGYCAVVQANIIHRDLKPTNILLTSNHEPVIIDFGYSQIIIANKNLTVFNVGSPSYMSPEAYTKTIYSEKSDVWSLGAIFYELLMNTTLDNNLPVKQYFQNLTASEYPPINFQLFGDVSKQILKGTLAVKPEQRITSHRIKYLLDKEIIGKKLCNKVLAHSNNSHENTIIKQNSHNFQSMKNFEFMPNQIDFSKLRVEQEMRNMKRKPVTMKAFSSLAGPVNSNNQTSIKMLPLTSAEVIQGIIKNESSKGSIQKKVPQLSSFQRIQPGSVKNTPSISRIDFKPMEVNKNTISSISYAQRRFDGLNINTTSNLVMGSREASKNISTIQIYSNGMRSTYTNSSNADTTNPPFINEYFNQSIRETKTLNYNDGFNYTSQSNNINLVSSVDRKPIISQNDQPMTFSSQVRAGATRYVDFEQQPHKNINTIYDLSNTFQNKKSTKRLSFASTFKEKTTIQDLKPTQNFENLNKYDPTLNENLINKKKQNSQSKLSFKTMTPVNHVDMREGQLKNLNKPNRPQNNFESQNVLNFRQKPQPYQTPKSYQDLGSKNYQTNQPISYQKAHYPPKPASSNNFGYGYERMSMQNQGQNWMNHQPLLQYQHGTCHLRNSSEMDSRNILSLRKII